MIIGYNPYAYSNLSFGMKTVKSAAKKRVSISDIKKKYGNDITTADVNNYFAESNGKAKTRK